VSHRWLLLSIALIIIAAGYADYAHCTSILPFSRAILGPWNYSQESKVGLDADYDHCWWTTGPERVLAKFARNSLEAQKYNITYVAGLYYLGDIPKFEYVHAVSKYGKVQTYTPSYVDRTYWRELIEKPGLAVANLSLYYPIWGLAWDFEHYLSSWDFRMAKNYTFDQQAVEMFSNETGIWIPNLSAAERYPYLRDHGLIDRFEEWQREKVYELASETERKIHSINPNLSLGILGFGDSWFLWTILAGFNSSTAPVTAWTEDTYRGYNEGWISYFQEQFRRRHLYGSIIPGLHTVVLSPWRMITNMKRAIRHNGVFWIYQHDGDQYRLADEKTYSLAYQLFDRYFFFNSSIANPLPAFTMYPNIDVRPYRGLSKVTLLLQSHHLYTSLRTIELPPDSPTLGYVGENLTGKKRSSRSIRTSNLPCILYGFSEDDLERTVIWSMIKELDDILSPYSRLGFPAMTREQQALEMAVDRFESGDLEGARAIVQDGIERAFETCLAQVSPLLDHAASSPRESPIPIHVLGKLFTARRKIQEGDVDEGRLYLLAGIKEWAEAIPEAILAPFSALALLAITSRRHKA